MKYDVLIIGAGLGGLVCGNILSRAGLRVKVLEQGAQIGGCIQSYRRGTHDFDTGFHYVGGLGEGQSLHHVFSQLGLLSLPWQRMDTDFEHIRIGGRDFYLSQGFDRFVRDLSAEFPKEKDGIRRYADLLCDTVGQQFSLLRPQGEAASPFDLFERNAWAYLNETFHDPLLIDVLSGASLKMELRKETLPLFTFCHGNGNYIESSWRLQGGGGQIAQTLAEGIRRQGGEVTCRAVVEELVERDGKIALVRCADGEVYEATTVISSIHPAQTCALVKNSQRMKTAYRHRMARLENTFGMLTVSLLLKPETLPYFNHNRYVYRQPDVWNVYRPGNPVGGLMISARVPEDGSRYARQVDLLTPIAWEECARWAETSVGHRGEDYVAWKNRKADECIALAEEAVPGLRDLAERRYISTPLTYRDYTLTPQGTAYGLRKDAGNALSTLLSVRTPVPNLLLTGQNLMLHGVCGVTMTALFTCAEILGREWMWRYVGGEEKLR